MTVPCKMQIPHQRFTRKYVMSYQQLTIFERTRIKEMLEQKMSIGAIVRKLGRDPSTLNNIKAINLNKIF